MSHTHQFDGRWPFQDADDGDWQFLCGGDHTDGSPRILCYGWNREVRPPPEDDEC